MNAKLLQEIVRRQYELSRVNEVAAVFSDSGDGSMPPAYIVITSKDGKHLKVLKPIEKSISPLLYPLLFPDETPGYNINMELTNGKRLTMRDYASRQMSIATKDTKAIRALVSLAAFLVICSIRCSNVCYPQHSLQVSRCTWLVQLPNKMANKKATEETRATVCSAYFSRLFSVTPQAHTSLANYSLIFAPLPWSSAHNTWRPVVAQNLIYKK
jgi:hypothetical protein